MKVIDEINSIGILGGGQLGMFLCLAAKRFKKKISVYSESRHCSAEKFCDNFFYGSFEDLNRIEKFCNSVDIVTVETENIPIKTLTKMRSTLDTILGSFLNRCFVPTEDPK